MKTNLAHLALALAWAVTAFAQEKNSQAFSPAELTERAIHRRAVEAVIWGMPAVNYDLHVPGDGPRRQGRRQVVTRSSTGPVRSTGRTRP